MADFALLYSGGGMPETEEETARVMRSAESLDRAAELAKGSPVLQGGGSVTVYEIIEAM